MILEVLKIYGIIIGSILFLLFLFFKRKGIVAFFLERRHTAEELKIIQKEIQQIEELIEKKRDAHSSWSGRKPVCPHCGADSMDIVNDVKRTRGKVGGDFVLGFGGVRGEIDTEDVHKCRKCTNVWKKEKSRFYDRADAIEDMYSSFDSYFYDLKGRGVGVWGGVKYDKRDPKDATYSSKRDKKRKLKAAARAEAEKRRSQYQPWQLDFHIESLMWILDKHWSPGSFSSMKTSRVKSRRNHKIFGCKYFPRWYERKPKRIEE